MPYDDETYEDEQPEPGHLDDEEELAVGPRRPLDEEEPEEELEIDRPTYAPPRPAVPARPAPKKEAKAKPKRKKKADAKAAEAKATDAAPAASTTKAKAAPTAP